MADCRWTFVAVVERLTADCPAELPPSTTATGAPRHQTWTSASVAAVVDERSLEALRPGTSSLGSCAAVELRTHGTVGIVCRRSRWTTW